MSTMTPQLPQKEDEEEEEEEEDEDQGEPFEFDDSGDEENVPEDTVTATATAVAETAPHSVTAVKSTAEKPESQTQSEDPSKASDNHHCQQQPVSTAPTPPPAGQEGNTSTANTPTTNTVLAAVH
ncbi:hypothetical protein CRUP_007519 [Coryphaenoides rupestris]|nr:hypothetical protein CRUP_007519 [Coryphaenoides rupestris]